MVHEHTASTEPASAAAGYDRNFGVPRPRKRVTVCFGINAVIAPAMKNAGTRHSSTCAAR